MAIRPDKREIAQMVVLSALGNTAESIGRRLGRSPHTVRKYLDSEVSLTDPVVNELIAVLVETETSDLRIIFAKARNELHRHLDGGKMRPIEAIAAMDRSFQQLRLLEGLSTENISIREMVQQANANIKAAQAELKQLKAEDEASDSDND